MADVRLHRLYKSFGPTNVVRGVDLTVQDGEFLVVVGPSGCGKSTLLRLLAGLEEPTSGDIFIGGRCVNELRPKARDIAMVFQSYALYPHMTVRENMAFGLRVRKEPPAEIEERVAQAAELLGLTALLDRYPSQMSGGQRQRVAMGRAIVRRPAVFLFDEPLSNLDAALRAQMRIELKRLHRRLGATMFYVTHDQVEAMTMADRIALIHEGVIQQVGTPHELYDWPANRFTASFLGSPRMNFFPAAKEGLAVRSPGVQVSIAREIVRRETDGPCLLGIRPHALRLEAGDTGDGSVTGTVEALEPMGWETHVHLDVGGVDAVARVESSEARGLEPGATVELAVAPVDVRLFDDETGVALCAAPTGGGSSAATDRDHASTEPDDS